MSSNKTALITGASRGIGKATAEVFAQAGFHLTLTCRDSMDELNSFSKRLQEKYRIPCLPLQADMGCEKDVENIFSHLQTLDVLINNAGMSHMGLLTDMTSEQ